MADKQTVETLRFPGRHSF